MTRPASNVECRKRNASPIWKNIIAAASQGFHMFHAHTLNLCESVAGSEIAISRTFSHPRVQMYVIAYISANDGLLSMRTKMQYEKKSRKIMYAIYKKVFLMH